MLGDCAAGEPAGSWSVLAKLRQPEGSLGGRARGMPLSIISSAAWRPVSLVVAHVEDQKQEETVL